MKVIAQNKKFDATNEKTERIVKTIRGNMQGSHNYEKTRGDTAAFGW